MNRESLAKVDGRNDRSALAMLISPLLLLLNCLALFWLYCSAA